MKLQNASYEGIELYSMVLMQLLGMAGNVERVGSKGRGIRQLDRRALCPKLGILPASDDDLFLIIGFVPSLPASSRILIAHCS
jgi:hypothetical protein